MVSPAEVYVRNAIAMWTAQDPSAQLDDQLLQVNLTGGTRIILREPPSVNTLAKISQLAPEHSVVVEDVFTGPDAAPLTPTARIRRMPVMNRSPGPAEPPTAQVIEVRDPDMLAEAERVVVDGFPFPHKQPWTRGQALPPAVLDLPGWRVWLAYWRGDPAAAAYTCDDGDATGVYWLATLPAHRNHGLARAVMTTAIAARPEHEVTLVATEAGRPLYESLGFTAVAMASWHIRPPLTSQAN